MITDEGDLYCSGGYNAGIDLSLYLVAKYLGHEVALQSSKSVIADIGRTSQAPCAIFQFQKDHHDNQILMVQEWIEKNSSEFNYCSYSYNKKREKKDAPKGTLKI